eukprot:934073-Amorphochlora_amoeboformis.AAC.1
MHSHKRKNHQSPPPRPPNQSDLVVTLEPRKYYEETSDSIYPPGWSIYVFPPMLYIMLYVALDIMIAHSGKNGGYRCSGLGFEQGSGFGLELGNEVWVAVKVGMRVRIRVGVAQRFR